MKTNIFKTFAKTITTGFLCATVICGSVCGNMGGNVPPVKRGCLLDIVRLGGHDFANVGNVLAVVLKHKNPQNEMVTLVLISQIFPCKDDKCKDKLQSSLGNIKFYTALDWILKLSGSFEDKRFDPEIIDTIVTTINNTSEETTHNSMQLFQNVKSDAEWNHFFAENENNVLRYLCGLKNYLDALEKEVVEDSVERPGSSFGNGCVTSKEGFALTQKLIKSAIAKIVNKGKPTWEQMRILTGLNVDLNVDTDDYNEKSVIKDYINHATHTEAQLFVVMHKDLIHQYAQIKDKFIASTKLPCWSCVRLPYLNGMKIEAHEFGIKQEELAQYPNEIKLGKAVSHPRISRERQTKLDLTVRPSKELDE